MIEIPLDSPMEEKIGWAQNCYRVQGELFLEDEKLLDLLNRYKNAADESHSEMIESGVVDQCRECEEKEGGSCCGAGLENKYSGTLLLINLLLGINLVPHRSDPTGCFFLGKAGCLLRARHVICVNYLCNKVTGRIDPQSIATLREKEGTELELIFIMCERVKELLRSSGT